MIDRGKSRKHIEHHARSKMKCNSTKPRPSDGKLNRKRVNYSGHERIDVSGSSYSVMLNRMRFLRPIEMDEKTRQQTKRQSASNRPRYLFDAFLLRVKRSPLCMMCLHSMRVGWLVEMFRSSNFPQARSSTCGGRGDPARGARGTHNLCRFPPPLPVRGLNLLPRCQAFCSWKHRLFVVLNCKVNYILIAICMGVWLTTLVVFGRFYLYICLFLLISVVVFFLSCSFLLFLLAALLLSID